MPIVPRAASSKHGRAGSNCGLQLGIMVLSGGLRRPVSRASIVSGTGLLSGRRGSSPPLAQARACVRAAPLSSACSKR